MSKYTKIQWCDSSLNLQMGCDGCELWNRSKRICYAGKQTEGRRGFKGWPKSFDQPELFLDRLEPALKWKDLTGTDREEKPWLDKLPRIVFLNDMGDTFAKSLPLNWMAAVLPRLATSPHQFLLLTKRPSRLVEFAERFPLPKNVWPGTTITSELTVGRADQLRKIRSGGPKFLSCEPLWSFLPADTFEGMQWVIFGGESGDKEAGETGATITDLNWIRSGARDAADAGAKVFVKQLGSAPIDYEQEEPWPVKLNDSHGGDWSEWPIDLQIRQMPDFDHQPALL